MPNLELLFARNLELLGDRVNDLVERRRAAGIWSAEELAEYRRFLFDMLGLDERPEQEQG